MAPARGLGVLAASILLGPVLGWPLFRLLGYSRRDLCAITAASGWLFGAV